MKREAGIDVNIVTTTLRNFICWKSSSSL